MFPSNWSDSQFYIAMLKARDWGSDWWIETDKSLFSSSHAYTVTHTHHSSRPTGLSTLLLVMDVCYLEHLSDASRSADLSVSDLAGHRIYGLHLVMVCWWSCVCEWRCVCACVYKYMFDPSNHQPAAANFKSPWACWCSRHKNLIWCMWKSRRARLPAKMLLICSLGWNIIWKKKKITHQTKFHQWLRLNRLLCLLWIHLHEEKLILRKRSMALLGVSASVTLCGCSFTEMIEGCTRV